MKQLLILFILISSFSASALPLKEVEFNELYSHFFNIDNDKECKKDINCKMLRKHLKRDTRSCKADPKIVETLDNYVRQMPETEFSMGKIKYLGFYPGKYQYNHNIDNNGALVIKARVYFKNTKDLSGKIISETGETVLDYMNKKLKEAAKVWTANNPYDYKVRFDFGVTLNKEEAQVTPKLKESFTRGPYFSKWSLNWSVKTIAHEMGHVLGLDDEYSNNPLGGDTSVCSQNSIMCNNYVGKPQAYHYYVILRRTLCDEARVATLQSYSEEEMGLATHHNHNHAEGDV